MAVSTLSTPNSLCSYYIQGDKIAIMEKVNGEWESFTESVANGLRLHYHSKYTQISTGDSLDIDEDLFEHCGVDSGIQMAIIDYVKARILEDKGGFDKAMYFMNRYNNTIKKYPHRREGRRSIYVPAI
jgi:hypothetical protein|tara:strand:+ start:846 stop:1229 length:384 start_codon:yes stop_codon:yes gene_type:complete